MAGISFNTNLAAARVNRRLSQTTVDLRESFNRLSSGLRINQASDDAAGLAIAEKLDVDARVYVQGIRNINDGVSLLNIAEGALSQISDIVIRERELSEQAANGTLSRKQRLSLAAEARALTDEANRILASTQFNGLSLLNGDLETLLVQAGFGSSGVIGFQLGDELSRSVGDGSIKEVLSVPTDNIAPQNVVAGDFNNDGHSDFVTANREGSDRNLGLHLGNGDGTFAEMLSFSAQIGPVDLTAADFNNDGNLDIISCDQYIADTVSIFLGNGNGTFQAQISFAVGSAPMAVVSGDFNGDGRLDIASANYSDDTVTLLLGDGARGILSTRTIASGDGPTALAAGDFNGDGFSDLAAVNYDATVNIFSGGSGGLSNSTNLLHLSSISHGTRAIVSGDFNMDGLDDLAAAEETNGRVALYLSHDGTLSRTAELITANNPYSIGTADLNGDGASDLVSGFNGNGVVNTFLGAGDGTFTEGHTFEHWVTSVAAADFNEDGAVDLVAGMNVSGNGNPYLALGNPHQSTAVPLIDLSTRKKALDSMSTIDALLRRISGEMGAIGAAQSRFSTAVSNLQYSTENFRAAESRIVDADVALEAAALVRNQILQQAGAAVLGQANQLPQLGLQLLKFA